MSSYNTLGCDINDKVRQQIIAVGRNLRGFVLNSLKESILKFSVLSEVSESLFTLGTR